MSIVVRPQARDELAALLASIRSANARAADDVQNAVQHTLELLESQPLSGSRLRVRGVRITGLRAATVSLYPQFLLLYLPTADGIDVLHVVRGKRNLSQVLAHD